MKRLKRITAVALAATGLSACTSDPAFWDAVAAGLDQAAYDLANEPVCNWYTDRYGVVRQHCQPAYIANGSVYVPDYRDHRDHGRDHHRDGRDDRRDRDHRRGPKG